MAHLSWKQVSGVVLIYAGGIVAGSLLSWLRVPLPWMIGPMILAGSTGALGVSLNVPKITRPIGQVVVAATVGLSFTPSAVAAVGDPFNISASIGTGRTPNESLQPCRLQ